MALEVKIKKKFSGFTLDIEFENKSGKLGILGASGSGKSMTLKCIAGIEKPDSGRIVLNGRILFDSKQKINLRPQERNVGYLFQNYALFPNMTVAENIGIGIRDKDKQKKKEMIEKQLKQFQLEELGNRYPSQLSGGQQQRVALARILAYGPDLVMLDEPFSALDSFLKEVLQEQLVETLEQYHGDIVMVTHSRDEVYRFCEKLMAVHKGQSVLLGETKALFVNPVKAELARLTGCKNISPIRKIDDYTFEALSWGCILHWNEPIEDKYKYLGIRAHDMKAHWDEVKDNCIALKVKSSVEFPFEHHFYLETEGGRDVEHQLCWYVPREKYSKMMDKGRGELPKYLYLPRESMMLLEE